MVAIIFLVAAVVLAGIDQLIKLWIVNNTELLVPRVIIENVLSLTQAENTGAAFSVLTDKIPFLIVVTSISLIFICVLILSKKIKSVFLLSCLSLILAGGLGNLFDRIFRGYVVDYIDIRLKPFDGFAIFNFADCLVVIGSLLLLVYIIIIEPIALRRKNRDIGERIIRES